MSTSTLWEFVEAVQQNYDGKWKENWESGSEIIDCYIEQDESMGIKVPDDEMEFLKVCIDTILECDGDDEVIGNLLKHYVIFVMSLYLTPIEN